MPDIDKIDARNLRVLQQDGRISNLKLAEAVHLSPTAVLERVKRLTREGYILGYEARLNPAKLGAAMLVFIEVLPGACRALGWVRETRAYAVMEEVKSTTALAI